MHEAITHPANSGRQDRIDAQIRQRLLRHELAHTTGEMMQRFVVDGAAIEPHHTMLVHLEQEPDGPGGTALACFSDLGTATAVIIDTMLPPEERCTSKQDMRQFMSMAGGTTDQRKAFLRGMWLGRYLHAHRVLERMTDGLSPVQNGIYGINVHAVMAAIGGKMRNIHRLLEAGAQDEVMNGFIGSEPPGPDMPKAKLLASEAENPAAVATILATIDAQLAAGQDEAG